MRTRRQAFPLFFALLILLAAGLCQAAPVQRQQIDPLVAPFIDNGVVVGMTVGVLKEGEQTVAGYGNLSPSDERTPDGDTIYEIGSITKVFTGLLLADAVVQGHVTLNTPINDLLPKRVALKKRGDQPAALWHLATHTSGLPRLPTNFAPADPNNPYASFGGKELAAFLASFQPRKRPCEEIEYSNLGAGMLGELLARERKTNYQTLLHERIAKPLDLSDTTITLSTEQRERLAPPHLPDGSPGHEWDFGKLAGAGAIRSTTNDLLKFAKAYLESPGGELGEALGLSWCVHQKPIEADDFALGLAWHIARDGSTRWHNGQTGGYHSVLFVSRPLKTAVVVLANTATGEIDALAQDLMLLSAGAKVEPRNPGASPDGTVEVPAEVMQRYVGKYELARNFVFTVTEKQGKLFVGVTNQPTHQVYPRSETEWFYTVVDATLTFEVNRAGKATAVTLFQNGVKQRAKRVE